MKQIMTNAEKKVYNAIWSYQKNTATHQLYEILCKLLDIDLHLPCIRLLKNSKIKAISNIYPIAQEQSKS